MTDSLEERFRGRFGRPLRHLDSVDSTNTEALRWMGEDPPADEGAVVVADEQTAGRGRWGRRWISDPEASLVFTLILRPTWGTEYLGLLTVAAGLACARAFGDLLPVPVTLKWPNDVLLSGRKVAGILAETRVSGHKVDGVALGIGVNLRVPEGLPSEIAEVTTSLADGSRRAGRDAPGRAVVLGALLAEIERVYDAIATDPGRRSIVADATELMPLLGCEVELRFADDRTTLAVARRLREDGALEVDTPSGPQPVHVAEVVKVRGTS